MNKLFVQDKNMFGWEFLQRIKYVFYLLSRSFSLNFLLFLRVIRVIIEFYFI